MKLSTEKQLKIFQKLERDEEYIQKVKDLRQLYGIPSNGYHKDALDSGELQILRGVMLTEQSLRILLHNFRPFSLNKNQITVLADYLLFNYFSFGEMNFNIRQQNFPIKKVVRGASFNPNYLPEPPHLYLEIFPNTTFTDIVKFWGKIREYRSYLKEKDSGEFRVFTDADSIFIEIGPSTTQKTLKSSWEEVRRLQRLMPGYIEEQYKSYIFYKQDAKIIELHKLGYTAREIIEKLELPPHIYDKDYINKKIRRFKGKKN